jgi:hypothetical protein
VNRNVRVADVMGEHEEENSHLAVVETDNIPPFELVRDFYGVSDGLAQGFAPVRQIAGPDVEGYLLPEIRSYEFEAGIMGRRAEAF